MKGSESFANFFSRNQDLYINNMGSNFLNLPLPIFYLESF